MIVLNEREEIDLLTGSGGEDGRGCAWTGPILSSLIITREKNATKTHLFLDIEFLREYKFR